MARTIAQIQVAIAAERGARAELAGMSSPSVRNMKIWADNFVAAP